jgi:hypothetical protein
VDRGEFAQDGIIVGHQNTGGVKFNKMRHWTNFGADFIGPTPSGTGTPEPV